MEVRLPEFISYLSQFMTLEPGDLILTGSPKPLGKLRFLSPGDRVRISIERVGTLNNLVAAE
jgi:5-oxopent-3-ene-1,2,5-tricarboxylate decarboxylase/2-hydroxyhepta-2,4-diene-1,7-dioate isomerase